MIICQLQGYKATVRGRVLERDMHHTSHIKTSCKLYSQCQSNPISPLPLDSVPHLTCIIDLAVVNTIRRVVVTESIPPQPRGWYSASVFKCFTQLQEAILLHG